MINSQNRKVEFGAIDESDDVILLSEVGKIVDEEWLMTAKIRKELSLGVYKIMPDLFSWHYANKQPGST